MIKLASALNLRKYAKDYLSLIQYYKNFDLIRRLILTNIDVKLYKAIIWTQLEGGA